MFNYNQRIMCMQMAVSEINARKKLLETKQT